MCGTGAWWLLCDGSQDHCSCCPSVRASEMLPRGQKVLFSAFFPLALLFVKNFPFKRSRCPWVLRPRSPSHSPFHLELRSPIQSSDSKSKNLYWWLRRVPSILIPTMSGFPNGHLKNPLLVALFKTNALGYCVSASTSEVKPIYTWVFSTTPPPAPSLYLKRWLITLGPCVFIHLFVVKTQQGVSSGMGKAPRVRPFAKRGWRFGCGGGDSLLAGACW